MGRLSSTRIAPSGFAHAEILLTACLRRISGRSQSSVVYHPSRPATIMHWCQFYCAFIKNPSAPGITSLSVRVAWVLSYSAVFVPVKTSESSLHEFILVAYLSYSFLVEEIDRKDVAKWLIDRSKCATSYDLIGMAELNWITKQKSI
ncbi:hypothetical protein GOBAR_AA09165 [Gossypium barbadense]|uniref:Uncharacterized protein n=1 Tax=Gossypium barbadense TaxID=3634 RepID=A0A2P5Y7A5_GOSBA|nr:hypothetical protein GOBAR_AA09165 [Gossypium barbadense]